MKQIILNLEEKLRIAMIKNDIETLSELIADDLVFISPMGDVVTKNMDLEAHRLKLQKISSMTPSEQTFKIKDDLAIITVKMQISGFFNNIDMSGNYRYLRIWKNISGSWQIISGSVTKILE